jgi:hypothetical protein
MVGAKKDLRGTCYICGTSVLKREIKKHLDLCKTREHKSIETSEQGWISKEGEFYHIVVEGRGTPEYWLHIEADADATLEDLDTFLRDIWLECCGHMSGFRIGDVVYEVAENKFLPTELMANYKLRSVLREGMKFYHDYDYGTPTRLTLKVLSTRKCKLKGGPVRLLARNESPEIYCDYCGKNIATQICSECTWEGEGWLCEECIPKHDCGEDMLLPVANSPRAGVCGYTE